MDSKEIEGGKKSRRSVHEEKKAKQGPRRAEVADQEREDLLAVAGERR